MKGLMRHVVGPLLAACCAATMGVALGQTASGPAEPLPGTVLLAGHPDAAAEMVAGIDRFLTRETETARRRRGSLWPDRPSQIDAYLKAVETRRNRLARIIGAVDALPSAATVEFIALSDKTVEVGKGANFSVYDVRWPVSPPIKGEGLLLKPDNDPTACVVALPDADWTPEMLTGMSAGAPTEAQFARQLAEAGCEVIVPVLLDRSDTFSGNPAVRMTNQPHREFIYRMAYTMGRHVIGYEVQKVRAAVTCLKNRWPGRPIGVIGYGEGGLLALYSAAVDPRIDATVVSGYFQPRDRLWSEPIYRNVWSLLRQFGDAELSWLIAPRGLIVEACKGPIVPGPPAMRDGRFGAAPGSLLSPDLKDVQAEVERSRPVFDSLKVPEKLTLTISADGQGPPGCSATLRAFLAAMGVDLMADRPQSPTRAPTDARKGFDPQVRLKRQLDQMTEHVQALVRQSESRRRQFWSKADASSPDTWQTTCQWYRKYLWEEIIGRLPDPTMPANPRTRLVYDAPAWKGYEVMLDVWPDVFAEGILLVPKGLKPGERRPVVVCQHGLEGHPRKPITAEFEATYARFGARLAERGFVVYAPQNPYVGKDAFRVLQRKANPLKLSLYSVILGQHARTLEWLGSLPFVDPKRIGFYGISYGGRTAMMVPPLLDTQYAAVVCSANFNEWIWKTTSITFPGTYMFTTEYEIFDFDVGNTFNHAELAGMIAPRPFMVERGHDDTVGLDEWVAYEYAKVARLYGRLRIGDRTAIEYFDGVHQIHGVGSFAFLHKCLDWPEPR